MLPVESAIQAILDQHVDKGVIGASLALEIPHRGLISLTSGLADVGNKVPLRPDHLFRIASCTKLLVAASVHLLIERGLFQLNEPISKWMPHLPNADRISVAMLLNHSSGLPEFESYLPMISDRAWSAEELVRFAFEKGVQKPPGCAMEYNNTGYVIAGMIIEKETGQNYADFIRRNILAPLNLRDTWIGTHELYPVDRAARAYIHAEDRASASSASGAGEPVNGIWDATHWFPLSAANAAGDVVSTPSDMVRYGRALFAGKLLGQDALHSMKDDIAGASLPGSKTVANGHGLFVFDFDGATAVGHLGQIPGHTSIFAHDETTGATIMLAQNSGALDPMSFFLTHVDRPVSAIVKLLRNVTG